MRKSIVKDRSDLANVLTLCEAGKSQIKVGDMRQALKALVAIEAAGYLKGKKSIFAMLRKEAKTKAAKVKKSKGA